MSKPPPLFAARSQQGARAMTAGLASAVKGCSYIYEPKGQAFEYAPLACNPYRGCGHECRYCYVPLVNKQPRAEFNAGAVLRDGFLAHLRKDARRYQAAGITEQVMLSFTTDPYHLGDTSATRAVLEILTEHGLAFCTLTKGGTRSLRDLDLFRPTRDAFACTLTSLDDAFARKWKSRAALPGDRVAALRSFHDVGVFTWVSLEPTLDVESSLAIVEATHSSSISTKSGAPTTSKKSPARRTGATTRYACSIGSIASAHCITSNGICSRSFRRTIQTLCAFRSTAWSARDEPSSLQARRSHLPPMAATLQAVKDGRHEENWPALKRRPAGERKDQ